MPNSTKTKKLANTMIAEPRRFSGYLSPYAFRKNPVIKSNVDIKNMPVATVVSFRIVDNIDGINIRIPANCVTVPRFHKIALSE
jgi:hypothetical protein